MNIIFSKLTLPRKGTLVVAASEGGKLSATAAEADRLTAGAIARALGGGKFKGRVGQHIVIVAPHGLGLDRIIVAGFGKPDALTALAAERVGGGVAAQLARADSKQVFVAVDALEGAALPGPELAARVAHGALLRAYRFDKYRTKKRDTDTPALAKLTMLVAQPARARARYAPLQARAEGVYLTRDLVSEPANVLSPEALAAAAQGLAKEGVKVESMGPARLKRLGMGALLGVAQGSIREPRVVVMHWQGGGTARPLAFVGKGVTFDTGGISIKPSGGMEDMKWDMGGAGTVIGLMRALARRKAKVNAIGVVGLVENMPSGSAQRPGDVVTSMSGQTIEVINTDAEGRLVLGDVLWYTQDRFKPRLMIDLATLTGAIIVSLGNQRAGMFCNDDTLRDRLLGAGDRVGEKVWPMPLDEAYDKDINSDIADMKNVGSGRGAGSIAAAKFLQRYVNKTPWAHLDIAGVTWARADGDLVPRGGTGFGVRLLDELVAGHYER